jgi:hypothetical protein
MGRSEREKGKRGERATAREIAAKLGVDAHRGQQARDGADAPDVVGIDGWWIEVKTGKALSPKAALLQADEARKPEDVPVAVLRYDRERPMAIMYWEDLLHLMETARER